LAGQQWLLAGVAFVVSVVLIMILLRYNEGFWGTLGLAAVLGGAIGNLIDRVFNDGKVIDMFRTLFFNFPIFNIADIFITLGFATFLVHFISLSFKNEKREFADSDYEHDEYSEEYDEDEYDEFPEIDSIVAAQSEQQFTSSPVQQDTQSQYAPEQEDLPEEKYVPEEEYVPEQEDHSFTLDALESELELLEDYEDYDVDDLLREYGYKEDD
jgi:hypothetical protein